MTLTQGDSMPATTLASLDEVLGQLKAKHFAGNELKLAPVCTRVMLRTGANLRQPNPQHLKDSAVIAKVIACLAEMGYPV
jgi:hypothetical protein